MFPFEKFLPKRSIGVQSSRTLFLVAFVFFSLLSFKGNATTCVFTQKIIASQNPFSSCPNNTDTIIIRDTFLINQSISVMVGSAGVLFDGKFIIDGGGVLVFPNPATFKLGPGARILMFNGGHIYPSSNTPGCTNGKRIFFDINNLASCNGIGSLHTFADVNAAGCFDISGICCDATITVKENSGNPNDLTLCEAGDSLTLSVVGSGSLNYEYHWLPNIGSGPGPYKLAQFINTTYNINIGAQFDPEGSTPAYWLSCSSSSTVKINSPINLIANTTPVPCASAAVGTVNLTVSGGTAPYKYLWSINGRTTEDLNNLVAGTYTVTVTDAKGCTEVKSATVQTLDNTPPTLSCPGNASGVALANQCATPVSGIDAVFSDNCPSAALSYVVSGATTANGAGQLSNGLPFNVGLSNVKYQVSDGTNVVSCFFAVTVTDNQYPTASNPETMVGIQCFGDIPAPNPSVVFDEADNCGTPTVSYLSQSIIGGASCPGNPLIVSRKYRVTDASGNGISVTQLIQVADTQAPMFTQVPANTTVSCESVPVPGTVNAADNCSANVTVSYLGETRTNGACSNTYTLTRTWRAQDDCGNSATTAQIITVQDLTKPVFASVPANVTVNCQSVPAVGNATANDNCDASVSITYLGETRTNGACPGAYTLRRTWKAEDNCSNTATAEQLITVQDVTAPNFTSVPANVTVSCESVPTPGNPVATDNCDANVSISYLGESRTNGACPDTYTLLRSWRATDHCGNSSTATQLITVRDLTAPAFTSLPTNVTVSCDAIPPVGTPTATDNCDSGVTITYNGETKTNGSCPNSYTLKRQWTATDNCGNTQTGAQILTVQDLVKPTFTFVPTNTTVSCEAVPPVGTPVATDNCGTASISYVGETREDGACLNTYLLRRQWMATDQCGNTATAEQVINVRDITAPVFTFVPGLTSVSCDAIPAVGTPTAADNCSASVNIVYNGETRIDGSCPNNYVLTRRWTATDNCGNTAVASQTITVHDNKVPVFTSVPAATTASCESLPLVGTPIASDNCTANVLITYLGESVPGSGGACPGNYEIVRTWSAQDGCGNTATATQSITVQDVTPPVVLFIPLDALVTCANIPAVESPTASDNCDATPTITYDGATQINGVCPNSYTLKRQWTVSDDCGNTATAVQTITVQDINAPAFTSVPANITVNCDNVPSIGAPIAVDDCAANVNITFNGQTRQNGLCPDSYTLTRKWTAVDACGNASTTAQIITVQDVTPPAFTFVPAAASVDCDAVPTPGNPTATDNCDAAVDIQYSGEQRVNGACPYNYSLVRTWVATDNCGNTVSATQLISVSDTKAPVFSSVPQGITVSCEALPPVGTPTATDNCSAVSSITYLGEIRTDGACSGSYTLTRSWSAQDECGNSVTATQKITVQDNTKPVVTAVPANITVSCSAIPAVGTPTATDNCDADLTITYNGATRLNGACPNTYTLKRQWTITDDCGNASTAAQTIEVVDNTPPVFTSVPSAVTASCESIPAIQNPTATDDCAAVASITFLGEVRTNGTCPDSYTLKRSWVAKDSCGNTATAEQVITVQDITVPNFTLVPPDVVVNCDAVPMVSSPSAVDNCDAFVNIAYSGQTRIDGNCTHSYFLRREWVATDNCNNTSVATQMITVQDVTAPQFISVPANVTVNCESVPSAGTPTATDNCDGNVSITYAGESRTDGNCPNTYTLKRTWTAQDDCGNTKTAVQTITVHDIARPVFTYVPADSTVNCNAVPLPGTPIAIDNCTTNPTVVFLGESVMNSNSLDSYTLQRKWSATDECNNTSTAIQMLTVQDTIAPSIQCPDNISLVADPSTCTGVATFSQPTTSDNCSATLTVSSTANSGQAFPIGVTPVTMTVKDPTGNVATCEFSVTVLDKTAPVLVDCPSDFTVTTDPSSCEAAVNWTAPTVTDPCDQVGIVTTVDIANGSVLPTGVYPVTYTAVDTSGNSTQCSFTVTVREDVPPVFVNCPQNITVNTDSCDAPVNWIVPSITDNCASQVALAVNIAPGSVFPETNTTVQYTATDNWGNSATCTFVVTVVDIVPPSFPVCPDNMLVNAGLCETAVSWAQPFATDNCSPDPTVYSVPAPGSLFPAGFTTVNVFVVDKSGNKDTCSFVVEVIGPAIGLSNVPVSQAFTGCDAIATWNAPTPTGICNDEYTLTSNYASGDTFEIGTTEVIYTLEDTLGHVVTSSFTITVTESVPPQFVCPSSTIKVDVSGTILNNSVGFIATTDTISTCDGVELGFQFPNASDNCSVPLVTQIGGPTALSVFHLGLHSLTFEATDDAGNTAQCAVQVEVLPLLSVNPVVSDAIGCKGDEITLSATPIPGAQYLWTGPNPPYPDNNNLVVLDVDSTLTGYYSVTANVNGCLTPLDSALVRIGKAPIAVNDLDLQVATNEILPDINVLLNDVYETDDYTLTFVDPPAGLINHGNGLFSFQAGNINTTVYLIYRLCSKACPNLCDEGVVSISVRERICSYIPNVITPNGDNYNDFLTIPCLDIEPYPQNHLAIYNQWGDKVFEAQPYVNNPDQAWRGDLMGEHGRPLPDATYFYIFKATPDDKGLKGYIEIFR